MEELKVIAEYDDDHNDHHHIHDDHHHIHDDHLHIHDDYHHTRDDDDQQISYPLYTLSQIGIKRNRSQYC